MSVASDIQDNLGRYYDFSQNIEGGCTAIFNQLASALDDRSEAFTIGARKSSMEDWEPAPGQINKFMREDGEDYHYELELGLEVTAPSRSFSHTFELLLRIIYQPNKNIALLSCGFGPFIKLPLEREQRLDSEVLGNYLDELLNEVNRIVLDTPPGIQLTERVNLSRE